MTASTRPPASGERRDAAPRLHVYELPGGWEVLAGRTMISGHTPQPLSKIEKMLKQNSGLIILDNGCFLAGRKGMGSLLALELNSMVLFSQKNIDIPGR